MTSENLFNQLLFLPLFNRWFVALSTFVAVVPRTAQT
ncbi:hypothetical protein SAMN05216167_1153 [Spirosoma endophyticum]|uniref:Uncharacterized protein n=1 Tax=Spirosoma endophyticum TaxID=662367 RepID=A0A1I2B640_9BACT|nr:hypothetical protein SAMN05216167_1153 [Spirosoma endophyticum]